MTLEVRPVAFDETLFAPLLEEAEAEGGQFLLRLRDDWRPGALRFERPGELLLGAFDGRAWSDAAASASIPTLRSPPSAGSATSTC